MTLKLAPSEIKSLENTEDSLARVAYIESVIQDIKPFLNKPEEKRFIILAATVNDKGDIEGGFVTQLDHIQLSQVIVNLMVTNEAVQGEVCNFVLQKMFEAGAVTPAPPGFDPNKH